MKAKKIVTTFWAAGLAAAVISSTAGAAEERTIGINNWFSGVYALDVLVNGAEYVTGICGDTVQEFNDEANAEKLITDLENMVSSGMDGIMWMGMFENNLATGPQIPNGAGIPFVLYDKISTNDAIKQATREMEYFAGGVCNDNYSAGADMAKAALKDGCIKVLIAGAEVGDPNTDARVNGFTETFETGGGEVLSVTRVSSGEANGAQQACDNMLAAYPEADCFYGTGQDQTLAALNVIAKTTSDHEIRVYGTDLNPDLLAYLADGSLAACCGANWANSIYASIMLENALDGYKMVEEDGYAAIIENAKFITVPSSCAELYQKFFIDENPYEESEIEELLYKNNPEFTLDDLKEVIDNFSLEERFAAKYEAGKISAEELEAAGVDISAYIQ